MIKNIIIAILAITSLLSIVFGYYERKEAVKWEALAVENEKRAREMAEEAVRQMKLAEEHQRIAEVNQIEALKQRQLANEALKKGSKPR